jgi:MFS family permease
MTHHTITTLNKRLFPLYIAAFFHGFVLWYAIEKLFMRQIGFDDAGIGVMVAAYCALMVIAETPTGILADRWSRKGVLVLARLALD